LGMSCGIMSLSAPPHAGPVPRQSSTRVWTSAVVPAHAGLFLRSGPQGHRPPGRPRARGAVPGISQPWARTEVSSPACAGLLPRVAKSRE
jgi:hypothetical protein